jgi:hypothetical protein
LSRTGDLSLAGDSSVNGAMNDDSLSVRELNLSDRPLATETSTWAG